MKRSPWAKLVQCAVDHSIAKRDEGVDAPDGEPVGQLMKKILPYC